MHFIKNELQPCISNAQIFMKAVQVFFFPLIEQHLSLTAVLIIIQLQYGSSD